MPSVNAVANGLAGSLEAVAAPKTKTFHFPSPPAAAAVTGRGLRRWRRIRRDQERPRDGTGGAGGGESSPASVESRLVLPLARPGPGGAGFGNSEDRSSWSSTAASAPRELFPRCDRGYASVPHSQRERDSPRPGAGTARNPHTARPWVVGCSAAASISTAADYSPSSVESGLRSSNAVVNARQQLGAAGLSGVRNVFSGCRGHGGEEVRSTGRCRGNGGSVVGRSVRSSAGEECVGIGGNGRMHWGADPCNESILMLQGAHEALENEIEKITAIGKELSDEFNVSDDEWSGSVHLEERRL